MTYVEAYEGIIEVITSADTADQLNIGKNFIPVGMMHSLYLQECKGLEARVYYSPVFDKIVSVDLLDPPKMKPLF